MANKILDKLAHGDLPLDFNWNSQTYPGIPLESCIPLISSVQDIEIVAEDLRDGLHGISEYPSIEKMEKYVDALFKLGVRVMTVGIYPGEKNRIDKIIKELLAYMDKKYQSVTPIVLSLATDESMEWLGECKKMNKNLNAIVFMGTAPSRLLVEEWERKFILDKLAWAVDLAVRKYKVKVIGATEHTTQTPPDFLREIITTFVKNGADFFCVADTIGTARPEGAVRIVKFVKKVLHELKANDVKVDWHGHDDLGNGVGNALAAIGAGANRVHTVARGIGERAGNTQMEAILLNCMEIAREKKQTLPWSPNALEEVLKLYDEITQIPVPSHGPLGKRAFSTSLGIHTSAMLKAKNIADESKANKRYKKLTARLEDMAQRIYTALDPKSVGRKRDIYVGPWSGRSTVHLAYIGIGGNPDELTVEIIEHVLTTAKKLGRELTSEELKKLLNNR